MGTDTVFESAALDILQEFGDMSATFQEVGESIKIVPALVNYNTEIQGAEFGVIQSVTTIEILKSSGIKPHRGDSIFADDTDFTVENIYSRDGVWVRMIVK